MIGNKVFRNCDSLFRVWPAQMFGILSCYRAALVYAFRQWLKLNKGLSLEIYMNHGTKFAITKAEKQEFFRRVRRFVSPSDVSFFYCGIYRCKQPEIDMKTFAEQFAANSRQSNLANLSLLFYLRPFLWTYLWCLENILKDY